MRSVNSIKNLKFVWVGQIALLLIKLFSRKAIMLYISIDYIGLDAVFNSIFGIFSIVECGVGSSIAFSLYKPFADNDYQNLANIYFYFKKMYKIIICIIAIISLLFLPCITFFVNGFWAIKYAVLAYFLYLINLIFSLLNNLNSVIVGANQENFIYTKNHYKFMFAFNVFIVIFLYFFRNYLCYVILMTVFTMLEYFVLLNTVESHFTWIKNIKHQDINNNTKLSINKNMIRIGVAIAGDQVIASTDNLLISKIINVSIAGFYFNYYLIVQMLLSFLIQIPKSITASLGNIVAMHEKEKEIEYFNLFYFINASIFAFCSVCLCNTLQFFITLWFGDSYIIDIKAVYSLVFVFFLTGIRKHLSSFKDANGVFNFEIIRSILESCVNIVLSIILGKKIGLFGIILGTLFSSLLIGLSFDAYALKYKNIISLSSFFSKMTIYILLMIVTTLISRFIVSTLDITLFNLFYCLLITILLFAFIWTLFFFKTKEFKETYKIIFNLFFKNKRIYL